MQKNIVILISGSGSNMASIVRTAQRDNWQDRFNARIAAVISNCPNARGLLFARDQGIATELVNHRLYASRHDFEQELAEAIDRYHPHLIVLAGFMRILTPDFVHRYANSIINIHPSLLPAFPGLHTHQRALEAGCRFAGATVHEVIPELDAGKIIDQAAVPVLPGDTAETLAERVLTQEHLLYPRAIAQLLNSKTPDGHQTNPPEG